MDYRIDDATQEMADALTGFLRDRQPDPATEPDAAGRAAAWRELAASEWLEHYAAAVGSKEADPADVVYALHVAEAFGAVPVTGPVHVVAGYLHPLAKLAGLDALADLLRGTEPVTAALPGLDTATGDPRWVATRLRVVRDGDRSTVSGRLTGISSPADAAAVVVAVEIDGAPALAVVRTDAPGVTVGTSSGVDTRRPVADLELAEVVLDADAVHSPGGTDLAESEHRAGQLASLFLDAEAVGGAAEVLARSVAYCTDRIQFGRPIGSFQAVRHRLADARVRTEGARSLLHRTGWDLAAGAPTALTDVLASRLWCSATYLAACEAAIQCHGGMGFTWEQRLQLWHRAAIAGRGLHTDPAAMRAAVSAHLRAIATEEAVGPDLRDAVAVGAGR